MNNSNSVNANFNNSNFGTGSFTNNGHFGNSNTFNTGNTNTSLNNIDFGYSSTHSPLNTSNMEPSTELNDFERQIMSNLLNDAQTNASPKNTNWINNNNEINLDENDLAELTLNGIDAQPTVNPAANNNMANIDSVSTSNDMTPNAGFQSPVPIVRNSSSLRAEAFSPESLGFSSNFANNKLSRSISNTLGRSYGSQLGTSLNQLISPISTYDAFLDSPYGSYNDDAMKSPMNSPSFKSIGSPSSVGTHLNPKSALSKECKLSRRRELHNAVERRRRDLIKEKIKELGSLIPPTMLYDSAKCKSNSKDIKANKNIILQKSVEYIYYLKQILDAQDSRLEDLQRQIDQLDLNYVDAQNNNNNPKSSSNNVSVDVNINSNNNNNSDTNNTFGTNENYYYNVASGEGLSAPSFNQNQNAANRDDLNMYFDEASDFSKATHASSELSDLKNSLSAFTGNTGFKHQNSKLNFMDFSNEASEPVDFRKLSESASGPNNLSNLNTNSNRNISAYNTNTNNNTDNIDLLLDLDGIGENSNSNYEFGGEPYGRRDSDRNRSIVDNNFSSPNQFNSVLQEPSLKFESDADFLDQLLSKEPTSRFGNI